MTKKKESTNPPKGRTGTALVPVTGTGLVPATIPAGGIVVRDGGTTLVAGRPYDAHGVTIPAAEIYHVKDVKPRSDGPWLGEADKIAWRDEATGYECIIMRARPGGHLCGYVGVPSSHPLHRFEPEAIPSDLGIEVHGGVTYGRMCQNGPTPQRTIVTEARRICHVIVSVGPTVHASDYRVEDAHAWWLGFKCDHISDVVPGDAAHAKLAAARGIRQSYRNDAYVFQEVTNLAVQLHAIAEDRPVPPRSGPPLPPISLDPQRGS